MSAGWLGSDNSPPPFAADAMKTCESCIFWRHIGHAPQSRRIVRDTGVTVIPPGSEGECRAQPPVADHQWAMTSAGAWCGAHTATAKAVAKKARTPATLSS